MTYYIKIDYKPETRISSNELIMLIREKQVPIDVMVRREESNEWNPANSLPEILEKLTPPLPEFEIVDSASIFMEPNQLCGISKKIQTTKKTDRLAIASLILSLLSYCGLTIITAIPALIIGYISLKRIKINPNLKGRWVALTAIYLIYIPFIITFLWP